MNASRFLNTRSVEMLDAAAARRDNGTEIPGMAAITHLGVAMKIHAAVLEGLAPVLAIGAALDLISEDSISLLQKSHNTTIDMMFNTIARLAESYCPQHVDAMLSALVKAAQATTRDLADLKAEKRD